MFNTAPHITTLGPCDLQAFHIELTMNQFSQQVRPMAICSHLPSGHTRSHLGLLSGNSDSGELAEGQVAKACPSRVSAGQGGC